MKNDLNRAVMNHEVTTLLAVDKDARRLWMKVNPSLGTITYSVVCGRAGLGCVCETLSLDKAIKRYNALGKERVA